MKKYIISAVLFLSIFSMLSAQKTISGIVKDDDGQPLVGASIVLKGTSIGTITDVDGKYSITVPKENMTIVVSFVGFGSMEIPIGSQKTIHVSLKAALLEEVVVVGYGIQTKRSMTGSISKALSGRLSGVSINNQAIKGNLKRHKKNKDKDPTNRDNYNHYEENDFNTPKDAPYSTFSIDVDKTAYTHARRLINEGQMPPKDAVRIEEMINYFDYHLPTPTDKNPVAISTEMGTCPWNKEHYLMKVDLQAQKMSYNESPSNNLVFLIDVSGSMSGSDRLELLKQAFKILVNQLRPNDYVSIVTYAGAAGLVLDATSGSEKETILKALDNLESGGSTAGGVGIELAYQIAEDNYNPEGNNRVILATDGDFNVGVSTTSELEHLIVEKREKNIFLSVLGVGAGNFNDGGMETLADKGNGNYFYLDNLKEAEKVFTKELTGTILTVARDVKFQIEFNPLLVQSYRLIGYENRKLNDEDFNNDKKDAGELGAGNSVTAFYEIIPQGVKLTENETTAVDPLHFQSEKNIPTIKSDDWIFIKLRYKKPLKFKSTLITQSVTQKPLDLDKTSDNFRFAAAVAGWGQILRDSKYKGNFNFKEVIDLANGLKGSDTEGYRQEFIDLVEKSMSIK